VKFETRPRKRGKRGVDEVVKKQTLDIQGSKNRGEGRKDDLTRGVQILYSRAISKYVFSLMSGSAVVLSLLQG